VAVGIILALTALIPSTAHAITILYQSPNTDIVDGLAYTDLEFDNPLTGGEALLGCPLMEWRDAGYLCPTGIPEYEDWAVNDTCVNCQPTGLCIDGYQNEIWLRVAGHSATTTTTVYGTTVSIHFHADSNDGIAEVRVDGLLMASIDLWTAATDEVAVIVYGLDYAPHTIEVTDAGWGTGGDDIALMGAAVLDCSQTFFWKGGDTRPMYDIDQKQLSWGLVCPPTGSFNYTWCGPVALANSIWWYDSYVAPGLIPAYLKPTGVADPVLLVEHLVNFFGYPDPDCEGMSCRELYDLAYLFYENNMPQEFYFHTLPIDFDAICHELQRSQDVILLLGFYFSDGAVMTRTGGHFVTLAGCGQPQGRTAIAFSDPYYDSNAIGMSPGRHNGPHGDWRMMPNDPANHNDPLNYSHDLYDVTLTPCPSNPETSTIMVEGYGQEMQEPFDGQNEGPPPDCPDIRPLPPGYYTFVDCALAISPLLPVTGAEDAPPVEHGLAQNYPNPFNPVTTIEYSIVSDGRAHLAVYDVTGKLVRTLVDEDKPAGTIHSVTWEGVDDYGAPVATGVYFYRLTANGRSTTKKMVLLK